MGLEWTEAPQAAIIFDWRWQIVFRLTPKFRTDQCVFLWCLSFVSFILNSIVKIITWDIILASTIIVIGVQFWLTAIQSFSKYFSEEKRYYYIFIYLHQQRIFICLLQRTWVLKLYFLYWCPHTHRSQETIDKQWIDYVCLSFQSFQFFTYVETNV